VYLVQSTTIALACYKFHVESFFRMDQPVSCRRQLRLFPLEQKLRGLGDVLVAAAAEVCDDELVGAHLRGRSAFQFD
ncbi:MAG: hypothetical protein ABI318_07275, partial [Chthoniobacteraceae bacterium]